MYQLQQIQLNIRKTLSEFQQYYITISTKKSQLGINNNIIISKLIRLMSKSTKSMEILLRMMSDRDVMSLAATCSTAYKVVYSPLGFRICRHLRPITLINKNNQQTENIPHFTQATVDQLCNDRNIQDADQDDKFAILMTMQTNILATKQKIRQLDLLIEYYDKLSQKSKGRIMYLGGQRQEYQRRCIQAQEQVQKLREVMKETEGHAESLRAEQEKIENERENKKQGLNAEKAKLERQKELLIKKIKSQQKEKQESLIYARQVSRILGRLNQITESTKNKGKDQP